MMDFLGMPNLTSLTTGLQLKISAAEQSEVEFRVVSEAS
jgi:hypothetical protein